jgi:hypothetical protein
MARYRSKDETDLRWNRTRRRITRELDIQIANWREEALDRLLTAAWDKFKASLESGDIIELEADYEAWVAKALEETVSIRPITDEVA